MKVDVRVVRERRQKGKRNKHSRGSKENEEGRRLEGERNRLLPLSDCLLSNALAVARLLVSKGSLEAKEGKSGREGESREGRKRRFHGVVGKRGCKVEEVERE